MTMGCSGCGTKTVNESKKTVENPGAAGVKGGTTRAIMQTVTVDILMPITPFPTGLVTIYINHPAQSLNKTPGAAPVTTAELISQGIATSGQHYTRTISVPEETASVYLGTMMGLEPKGVVVPIANGRAQFSGYSFIP